MQGKRLILSNFLGNRRPRNRNVPFSDSHESLYPEELLQSQNELTQVKLEVKKMQLHRKNSCVVLCVSRRKRAFYQKMTPLEVQHLVDNFTFQEFNIVGFVLLLNQSQESFASIKRSFI